MSTHGAVRHTATAFLDAVTASVLKDLDLSFYTGDDSVGMAGSLDADSEPKAVEWQVRTIASVSVNPPVNECLW